MSSMLPDVDGQDTWLGALRSKDSSARHMQHFLEVEQRERRNERERLQGECFSLRERLQQDQLDLHRQLESKETEFKEYREETQVQNRHLQALLDTAQRREIDLLARHEELLADMQKLKAYAEESDARLSAERKSAESTAAELVEVRSALHSSDEVRAALLREAQERGLLLDKKDAELQELHRVERSSRENAQAQYERLYIKCELHVKLAQEKEREAEVLQERVKQLEEALRIKGTVFDKACIDAEERRREVESKLERCQEDAASLQNSVSAQDAVQNKLRERISLLEAEVDDRKAAEQQLKQELFRLHNFRDETTHQTVIHQRQEEQLQETIRNLQMQLEESRTKCSEHLSSVFNMRSKLQATELSLQGRFADVSNLEAELSRARLTEEAAQKEASHHLQEAFAQRDTEVLLLQKQVAERRDDVALRSTALDHATLDFANQRSELVAANRCLEVELRDSRAVVEKLRDGLLSSEEKHLDAEASLAKSAESFRHTTQDLKARLEASENWAAQQSVERSASIAAAAAAEESAAAAWSRLVERSSTAIVAEKEVLTSPRLMPRWDTEILALHQSVEALQELTLSGAAPLIEMEARLTSRRPSKSSTVGQVLSVQHNSNPDDCILEAQQIRSTCYRYLELRLEWLRNRMVLWDAWETWAALFCSASTTRKSLQFQEQLEQRYADACKDVRAKLELAMADERLLVAECDAQQKNVDVKDIPLNQLPDSTVRTLKHLILEFRQRVVSAFVGLAPSGHVPGTRVHDALLLTRQHLGRVLHAAMFMYQKLRALVPTELLETLQDPLSQLVPLPFYVVSYKARQAAQGNMAAMVQGFAGKLGPASVGSSSAATASSELELNKCVTELEDQLPLVGSSTSDVPNFIVRLLQVRACAFSGMDKDGAAEAAVRDRVDKLLLDAITIFASGWRAD